MTGEKDPRDVMQAEHDARLSEHPAFRAPAEMPAIYRIADEFERELFAWRNLPSRDGAALRACAYALAQKAEALFAPILAEKERRISEWQAEVRREGDRYKDEVNDLNAECDRLHSRALAAEAALAAERERCATRVLSQRYIPEDMRRQLAAAIREEG